MSPKVPLITKFLTRIYYSIRAIFFLRRDWLVGIGVSLTVHAVVMVWLVRLEIPRFSEAQEIAVTLSELVVSPPDVEPMPEPELVPQSDSESGPQPVVDTEQINPTETEREAPASDRVVENSPNPDARDIRSQAIDMAREEPTSPRVELGASREAIKYAPAPRLLGTASRFDGSTGRVSPSKEYWADVDGSKRGRYVTASGRVYCSRQYEGAGLGSMQGPVLTYLTRCGRERPQSSDSDDPWVIGGVRDNPKNQDGPPDPPDFRNNSSR